MAKKATKKASKKKTEKRQFSARDHVLVPKHEVVGEEELDALFQKYKIQPTDLPIMYITDAALVGMEVKIGDIIKISRASPTAGSTTYFRRITHE